MRLPPWTPLAGGLVVAGGAVVLAVAGTPAHVVHLQLVSRESICATLEQPTQALLDQVAPLGRTAQGWAVSIVVVQWVQLLTFASLGIVMLRRRPSLLSLVSGLGLILVAA